MIDTTERRIHTGQLELRSGRGSSPGTLHGYAARFDSESVDLGGFTERISPGAFTEALQTSDVRALVNHDPNLVLGRTPKTLRLHEDHQGLRFELDLPDTTVGRDTAESVRRGDVSGCSFSFTLADAGDSWSTGAAGTSRREIHQIGTLFDIGPVTYPAYPDTAVAARHLDAVGGMDRLARCRLRLAMAT